MAVNPLFWLRKQSQYDGFAQDFSQTRQRAWPEFDLLKKELPENAKLLDIGCGNGRLLSALDAEQIQYTGVDISAGLLHQAKKQHLEADFQKAEMKTLPFKNHSFDAVVMMASLHHLPNGRHIDALREAFRVLRPGGKLFLTVWNLWQDRFQEQREEAKKRSKKMWWWYEKELIITFGKEKYPRMYYAFEEQELRELLEDCRFTDIRLLSETNAKNMVFLATKPKRFFLQKIPFDAVSMHQCIDMVEQHLQRDLPGFQNLAGLPESQITLFTPNPEMLVAAKKNADFKKALQKADLSVADGVGILWALDFLWKGNRWWFVDLFFLLFRKKDSAFLPEHIRGSDLFLELCKRETEQRIFLLGGSPGAAEKCREHFGEHIVGTYDGPVFLDSQNPPSPPSSFAKATADTYQGGSNEEILKKIQASKATMLFVALGAPKQELWIMENKENLPGVRFFAGVGGSFDFVAGVQKRAPKWMQKLEMEWLWRLLQNPRERFGRIWTALVRFPRMIAKSNSSKGS